MTAKKRDLEGLKRRSTNIVASIDDLRYLYKLPSLIKKVPTIVSSGDEESIEEMMSSLIESSFNLELIIKEYRALLRSKDKDGGNYRFTRTPEAVTGVYAITLYSDEEDSEPPIRKANESGTEGYEVIDITSITDTRYTERVYSIQIHLYSVLKNSKVELEKLELDYDWLRAIKANLDKILAKYWEI